jgi:hypothetical protein
MPLMFRLTYGALSSGTVVRQSSEQRMPMNYARHARQRNRWNYFHFSMEDLRSFS